MLILSMVRILELERNFPLQNFIEDLHIHFVITYHPTRSIYLIGEKNQCSVAWTMKNHHARTANWNRAMNQYSVVWTMKNHQARACMIKSRKRESTSGGTESIDTLSSPCSRASSTGGPSSGEVGRTERLPQCPARAWTELELYSLSSLYRWPWQLTDSVATSSSPTSSSTGSNPFSWSSSCE